MVSRWLVPGKRLNATLQFACDFTMPEISDQKFIIGEVMLTVETQRELEQIQKNLPIIENEIRLGVTSLHQASRILEIKGLTADEKTAMIQENISSLVKRRPQDFDYDILSQMQHFLVLAKDEFKRQRNFKHISRIICIHYLFRRALKLSHEVYPDRRYISIKISRELLENKTRIIGIIIGISFLRSNELLQSRHLLSAIHNIIPDARTIDGSFFFNQGRNDSICTFYVEIEREQGQLFTHEQIKQLKAELPREIETRIEKRQSPIFMPHNEEGTMRDILTLSHQLKYVRDIPQVTITFSGQTDNKLEFMVIVLRLLKTGSSQLATILSSKQSALTIFVERKKVVGQLRKIYKKEATVLRVQIDKTPFLRQDHSIDLYKVRQKVSVELRRVLGEFRDFNGGTISKEQELLSSLRMQLGKEAIENSFFLENFFLCNISRCDAQCFAA